MKKLRLLYFVALMLMVAVGAKAGGLNVTSNHIGKILCTDGTIYSTADLAADANKVPVAMIAYVDEQNHKGLAIGLFDALWGQWTEIGSFLPTWVTDLQYDVVNATWKVPSTLEWQQMLIGCGAVGTVTGNDLESVALSTNNINAYLDKCSFGAGLGSEYWADMEYDNTNAWYADFTTNDYTSMTLNHKDKSEYIWLRPCLAFDINTDIQPAPIKVGEAENGTIQADLTEAVAGETVTLTATPAEGYILENIVVTDQDNHPVTVVGGTWYSYGSNDNKATFDMPTSNVTVVATFTNAKTAADGLYMRMPTWGEVTYIIPDDVYSFKILSDGLNGGFHSSKCSAYLTLKTSENHIFQLNCNYKQSAKSGFTVYDGASGNCKEIVSVVKGSGGVDTSHNIDIPASGLIQSTTPNMTILYWSDMQHDAQAWFDMTVSVATTYIASATAIITSESQVTLPSLNVDYGLSAPGSGASDATIDGEKANLYTLCLPYDPDVSSGMKFYTLGSSTESSLKFMEITGSPAANTPYLVAVFTNQSVSQNINTEVTLEKEIYKGAATEGFKFLGTTTGIANAEAAEKNAFILQDGNKWGRVPAEHPEVYIPPFRAYIVPTAATGRSVLVGSFGDATGITTLQLTDRDGTTRYFDLNGRRISNPTTQGVYVTNGKKVIIK